MDLLVEKLDGSRYYLSQYKVLITEFEESAPSVTRNSKQLDQRNGNIDFGGWHTGKTINITGYYRADDMDEEEMLREKLYALLSDPDGYYITQLKTTHERSVERPGDKSGGYYDKLNNYPSHKRFLVYTEAPEMELVGNVNGTLLYKLTAEFKTTKLPYGESVPQKLDVKPNVPYIGENLILGSSSSPKVASQPEWNQTYWSGQGISSVHDGQHYTFSVEVPDIEGDIMQEAWADGVSSVPILLARAKYTEPGKYVIDFVFSSNGGNNPRLRITLGSADASGAKYAYQEPKLEVGTATPWSPAPEDPGYNEWYIDTYYNTKNLAIPYAGTVPCNQLEQGFAIGFTAKAAASSLSFKIDDTELTYSGAVASGDVFMFSGFSYTQNGLSIVSKTNKAYFILHPDKPNRITCNVHGTVQIIGFQNLYA